MRPAGVEGWFAVVACASSTLMPACARKHELDRDVAIARAARGVELPSVNRATAALPEAAAVVVVSRTDVRLDGDPRPVATLPADAENGFASDDKVDGRKDAYVTPLAHALAGARAAHLPPPVEAGLAMHFAEGEPMPPVKTTGSIRNEPWNRVVVVADRHTPFRVVAEIAATAADAMQGGDVLRLQGVDDGTPTVSLVARGPDGFARVTVLGPPAQPIAQRPPEKNLAPVVALGVDGIYVRAVGKPVAPGCNDVGEGATIPSAAGSDYDLAALTACLKKLKKVSPEFEDETHLTLAAMSRVDVQTLARAVEAVVRTSDGDILFPNVHLSPGSAR